MCSILANNVNSMSINRGETELSRRSSFRSAANVRAYHSSEHLSSEGLFFTAVPTTYDLHTRVVPRHPMMSLPYEKHLFPLGIPDTIICHSTQVHDEYFSTNKSLGHFGIWMLCVYVYMHVSGCAGAGVYL